MVYLSSFSWGTISGWWTIACLVIAVLYASGLYLLSPKKSAGKRSILFAIRTVAVFILSFLLLAPLFKTVENHLQKPLILILQDNSSSVKQFQAKNFELKTFLGNLHQLKNNLGDDYDVREFHFDKNLSVNLSDSLNGKQTDISAALQTLNNRFGNENIGAVILASDGLYNRGSSPVSLAQKLKTNIYTVALGDTIAQKDVLIDHVEYNKTAFLGNDFVADIYLEAKQVKGNNLQLQISEKGKLIVNQQVKVLSSDFKTVIPVKINADKKGIHKYQISLQPVAGEISITNNTVAIYVEVIDNRKKVLILYDAPHPDVAAIRQSLEQNQNYEVKTSLWADFDQRKLSSYNLLILEQLPNNRVNIQPLITRAEKQKISLWYLLGTQSNLSQLDELQKIINVSSTNQSTQEVFAAPNASFTTFILSDSARTKISNLPPLLAPFGNYSTSVLPLLKQKIGTVITSYPLLVFAEENGQRTAILTGEGLWRWRLSEFKQYNNHLAFDELVAQSVQYLTVKSNQNRFNVTVSNTVFDEDENVVFQAELYNKSFELVNQPDVAVTIKNKNGKTYSFQFSRNNKSYQLDAGILPAGEYNYQSQTKLGDENFRAEGSFSIQTITAEAAQSAANHQLLFALAKENGGEMVFPDQINTLPNLIKKNENIKTVAYQNNSYKELIDEKWVFILIILLLGAEWFLRRRNGEV